MSISYSISNVTGSLKILDSQYAFCIDSMVDLWNNSNASPITTPFIAGPPNKYIFIFTGEGTATIEFSSESTIADGQGFRLHDLQLAEVTAVSGTVKFIAEKYLTKAETASEAWSNSKAISVISGTMIGSGFLLCDKNGSFSFKQTSGVGGLVRRFGGPNGTQGTVIQDEPTVITN
jgi:hypothetical protein